ncbi:hypothetical protein DL96DRAFT_1719857 [Flagelloscypha sp. PMI_526]|nr:hypothetical protein DL96DRAFT_1719857 [Flagelloscypha sp. PMI_526]
MGRLGCRKHSRSAPEIGPFESSSHRFQFKTGSIRLHTRLVPIGKLPSSKKAKKKDLGPAIVGEFDTAAQNAIVKCGKIAVANNLEHGAPSLKTLRSVEAEAKAEVANLTFCIPHHLFLRDQALKAVQRSAECLSHCEKAMAFNGPDSEAMTLDEKLCIRLGLAGTPSTCREGSLQDPQSNTFG